MIYFDGQKLIADSLIELHLFCLEDLGLDKDRYVAEREGWEHYTLEDMDYEEWFSKGSCDRVLPNEVRYIDPRPAYGMLLFNRLWNRMDRNLAGAILMDPAWLYKCYSRKGEKRSAQRHYECAGNDELLAAVKPVIESVAANDCAFFCWWTHAHYETFFDFYHRLGLKLKTSGGFTWAKLLKRWDERFFKKMYEVLEALKDKPSKETERVLREFISIEFLESLFRMNGGHYTRQNAECCALLEWNWKADKNKKPFRMPKDKSVRAFKLWPQPDKHSEKIPLHDYIDRLAPGRPKVEMFNRKTPVGTKDPWYVWGNEKGKFDESEEEKGSD